ncbi:MAG: MotA/TolQ/ExbB proton channel family protein [Candidatus Fermentibacteria bacterium]
MKRITFPLLLCITVILAGGSLFAQPADPGIAGDSTAADSTAVDPASIPEDTIATAPVPEPVEPSIASVAEEEAEEIEEGGIFSDMAQFFRSGGPAMWAILLFLAAGIAIIIERFIFLFTIADMKPEKFMGRIAEFIRKGSIEGAIASCADQNAPLARIIEAALRNYRNTERDIQNAVDEMALAELPRLNARTGYLAMLANVSTMVGLLGTIFGLIAAFESVAAADPAEKSIMLANGISMAMSTTAFGLMSAIPLLIAHSFFTAKTDNLIDDIDRYSVMVINMLAQARKEG